MSADSCIHSIEMTGSPKIVIIGAGIAGIAAGNYLANAGFTDFVILEATDRVGGRIWSIDLETVNGRKAELGANWIHGIDRNPIYKIATANHLLTHCYQGRRLGQKVMFLMESGDPVNTKVVEEVDWVFGTLIAQCEDFYKCQLPTPLVDDSVGSFVERGFHDKMAARHYRPHELRLRRMILEQRLIGESMIAGCHSMNQVSLSEVGSFEEIPGVHYVIPPGFEAINDILLRDIPPGRILLSHVATRVDWSPAPSSSSLPGDATGTVRVSCENGQEFVADHVIVTASLAYLKQHADRLFTPPLPAAKREAMNSLAMGTVNKVVLEFGGPILPAEVFRLELVWDREGVDGEDIADVWFKKIGSFEAIADNVLVGWLSGDEAEFMETLSDAEVGRTCTDMLQRFLKNSMPILPPLKHVTTSKWKSHPYILGGYTYIPVGGHAEDIETLAEPVCDKLTDKPLLLFAGEATHPTFYSSSHGALLSGQHEAQRIIDLYPHC